MEKINFIDSRDQFLRWAIIEMITSYENNSRKKFDWEKTAADALNIHLEINGCEIPFVKFLKCLEQAYDNQVEKKAKELIEKRIEKISQALSEIGNLAEEKLSEINDDNEPSERICSCGRYYAKNGGVHYNDCPKALKNP